ncbi:MAG: hypothetical protein N2561_05065 [Bacteroidetes bacterium]|nr:hypothetical protein [Rhodothermia bacterium]MCS7154518.1 hypothetical protein [Bacteroidota bacterium]MCX7906891.1 hypothetical protein [Bacteroidota bacterium]MDW8136830.1 heavy metal-binding domain-containing protein [Bacteroidota bacterium]MDW8285300.1 heavy metal-binding domain-containing protein [Bacteroidota bacterium]
MRIAWLLASALLGTACASPEQPAATREHAGHQEEVAFRSDSSWIRTEPIELASIDLNRDGKLYFCPMIEDKVWADQEGTCPLCRMQLRAIPIDEGRRKLSAVGIAVR